MGYTQGAELITPPHGVATGDSDKKQAQQTPRPSLSAFLFLPYLPYFICLHYSLSAQKHMVASAPTSEQYLEELRRIAHEVLAQSNAFLAHLDIEQLNWKPTPTSWSIAQCYQHLIVLNSLYFTSLERGMATAAQEHDNTQKPFTSGLVGKWLRTAVEPQAMRPLPTFSMFMPTAGTIPTSILSDFAQNQHLLIQYMERAHGMNLTRTKIATPASRFLRLRLGDVFAVLLAHEQRHIAQAQRVVHHTGFPR